MLKETALCKYGIILICGILLSGTYFPGLFRVPTRDSKFKYIHKIT